MPPAEPAPSSALKLWLLIFLLAAFIVWILSKIIHSSKSSALRINQKGASTDNPATDFDEPETIDIANLKRFFLYANALPSRLLGAVLLSLMFRGLNAAIFSDANELPGPALFISAFVLIIAGLMALTWTARSYWHIPLVVLAFLITNFTVSNYLMYSGPNMQYLDAVVIYRQAVAFIAAVIVYSATLFIIRAIHNRRSPRLGPGCCQSCGYNLQGLMSPRCPECGQPF